MAATQKFLLVHISDLHFSAGTDQSNPDHSHSIEHLQGIQRALGSLGEIDLLVASGDISNRGDRQSLITASGWLFNTIPIGAGGYTGLEMPHEKVGVVPGNHDAWNASSDGSLLQRRQKSLNNFNFAFPNHAIADSGCYYRWLEREGAGLYVAFVDSCFLGDTEADTDSAFGTLRYDQAIAKGKLTVSQTERLLDWHDRGMKGALAIHGQGEELIGKEAFAGALKVLVMHHYLFEPPERKSDYFMRVQHRDIVFRNIALSDFDILLCGHKHVSAFDVHDYGRHFDRRAVHRYMLNYFRRLIGLDSLPIQLIGDDGKKWAKSLTQLIEIVGTWTKKLVRPWGRSGADIDDAELAERVFEILKTGLDSPDHLRRNVEQYLREAGQAGASMLEPDELKRIQNRIAAGLSRQERKELKVVADRVSQLTKKLKSRALIQAMSGSSAKSSPNNAASRSFNTYKVDRTGSIWTLEAQRYDWDGKGFAASCAPRSHSFDQKL